MVYKRSIAVKLLCSFFLTEFLIKDTIKHDKIRRYHPMNPLFVDPNKAYFATGPADLERPNEPLIREIFNSILIVKK